MLKDNTSGRLCAVEKHVTKSIQQIFLVLCFGENRFFIRFATITYIYIYMEYISATNMITCVEISLRANVVTDKGNNRNETRTLKKKLKLE